jgi:LPS sulfotransferase NodH
MPPVVRLDGRQAVEWARVKNPWADRNAWVRTHPWRMYALSLGDRWLQAPNRFVIVTPGRTGSELLTDLLNAHPDIACEAEILHDRLALPEAFVAGRATKAGVTGAKAFGFKLHCGHFGFQVLRERPGYLNRLSAAGFHLIFLRRDNYLAQAISSTIASRTRWHWHLGDQVAFTAMELDPVEVLMMTYLFEESDRYLSALLQGLPHLDLNYEQDLMEPAAQQATVARIASMLGLPSAPTRSDHVRFTPRKLSEAVKNYDEIADLIRPTRFGSMLEADDDLAGDDTD